MLVVRIELVDANTGKVSELSRMLIANDGTGTRAVGNYDVRLSDAGVTDNRKVWESYARKGRVEQHDRRFEPLWTLVRRAIAGVDY